MEKQRCNILYMNQRTKLSLEAERFVGCELQTHVHKLVELRGPFVDLKLLICGRLESAAKL